MKIRLLTMLGLCFVSAITATEHTRDNLIIDKIMPISGSRLVEVNSRNIIRVYIQATTWGDGCRDTAFDLRKEDSHLYTAVLSALASGFKISVTVEGSARPIDDVCQAVSLRISQ